MRKVPKHPDTIPDFVQNFPPDLAKKENEKTRPKPCRIPARQVIIKESDSNNREEPMYD